MKYRREIDGLRAIAVLPVILFHAGFSIFSGGFAGVDVFFVISGYLITAIIVAETDRGDFSIVRFYERRARRILPALFTVMAVSIPFALMWMMPRQLEDFAQSLIAVSLFGSNILFWRESGYFEANSEMKPMLHTWSLSVEEQYYLIFPLFVLVLWRFGWRQVLVATCAVAALSLGISEWGWRNEPSANFFLAPSRVWELFAGSICALLQFRYGQWRSEAGGAAGLALVAGSILFYDETVPFPSVWALAPVGGTALIVLFAARGTAAARILSWGPFVWVGLISYSAYLWHQPLFAFARIKLPLHPEPWLMGGLAGLSLALAWLTWRFVEQPFRGNPSRLLPRRGPLFAASGIGLVAMMALGVAGHLGQGMPWRLPEPALAAMAAKSDQNPMAGRCFYKASGYDHSVPALPHPPCVLGEGPVEIALIGDSHSSSVGWPALEALAQDGHTVTQVSVAGCNGFPGFARRGVDCARANAHVWRWLEASPVQTVILANRWTTLYYGDRYDNGEGGVEKGMAEAALEILPGFGADPQDTRARAAAALWKTGIERLLEHRRVVLVYPIPEAGWDVPLTLARIARDTGALPQTLSTDYGRFLARNGPIIDLFDSIEHPNLVRVKPHEILCDTMLPGRCVNSLGREIYYADDNHLSNTGTALLVPALRAAVDRAEAARTD